MLSSGRLHVAQDTSRYDFTGELIRISIDSSWLKPKDQMIDSRSFVQSVDHISFTQWNEVRGECGAW
jgi:hypothetical protein